MLHVCVHAHTCLYTVEICVATMRPRDSEIYRAQLRRRRREQRARQQRQQQQLATRQSLLRNSGFLCYRHLSAERAKSDDWIIYSRRLKFIFRPGCVLCAFSPFWRHTKDLYYASSARMLYTSHSCETREGCRHFSAEKMCFFFGIFLKNNFGICVIYWNNVKVDEHLCKMELHMK